MPHDAQLRYCFRWGTLASLIVCMFFGSGCTHRHVQFARQLDEGETLGAVTFDQFPGVPFRKSGTFSYGFGKWDASAFGGISLAYFYAGGGARWYPHDHVTLALNLAYERRWNTHERRLERNLYFVDVAARTNWNTRITYGNLRSGRTYVGLDSVFILGATSETAFDLLGWTGGMFVGAVMADVIQFEIIISPLIYHRDLQWSTSFESEPSFLASQFAVTFPL